MHFSCIKGRINTRITQSSHKHSLYMSIILMLFQPGIQSNVQLKGIYIKRYISVLKLSIQSNYKCEKFRQIILGSPSPQLSLSVIEFVLLHSKNIWHWRIWQLIFCFDCCQFVDLCDMCRQTWLGKKEAERVTARERQREREVDIDTLVDTSMSCLSL